MIKFIIGMMVGGTVGFFTAELLVAAKKVTNMRFENKDTARFMYLVRMMISDRTTYLLPVNEYYKTNPNKTLLGYYDEEYIYLVPSVVIGKCNDILDRRKCSHLNMLFRANLIKVGWVMRKDVRYRPEKRIVNTRRRYITFIRRELTKESSNKYV